MQVKKSSYNFFLSTFSVLLDTSLSLRLSFAPTPFPRLVLFLLSGHSAHFTQIFRLQIIQFVSLLILTWLVSADTFTFVGFAKTCQTFCFIPSFRPFNSLHIILSASEASLVNINELDTKLFSTNTHGWNSDVWLRSFRESEISTIKLLT